MGLVMLVTCADATHAQLLKVDINNTSRGDNTAPGYAAWNLSTDLGASPQRVTRVFTNAASNLVSCTIAQAVPAVKEFSWDHLAFELLRKEAESVCNGARTLNSK